MRTSAVLLVLAGCGGKDEAPPFAEIRDEILLPSCGFSSCHGAGAGGLTLDEEGAWAALVDAPSVGSPGEILVIPGDSDGSYLVWKLEGQDGIAGEAMPPGGALAEAQLEQILAWIEAGAKE